MRWSSKATQLAFGAACLIFVVLQMLLTVGPLALRDAPVEPDDAYNYILKAEQMRTCFLQDCPALNSLREQFRFPSGDEQVTLQQARQYHRLLVIYNPLQSAVLNLLSLAGLSYETAYLLLTIIAKLALCLGMVYWLHGLLGKPTAAVALLLLSPVAFAGTGLHVMVPSTIALAAAVWLWGLIAQRHPKTARWFVPLALAMMLFHEIGKIYATTALLLYVFEFRTDIRRSKRQVTFVLGMAGLIAGMLALPYIVSRPELNFSAGLFLTRPWDLLAEILPANQRSLEIARPWFAAYGYVWLGAALVLYGLYALWRDQRHAVLAAVLFFSFQVALGVVYVVPWYGALLFERAWVSFGIVLTGVVAYGARQAVHTAYAHWRTLRSTGLRAKPAQPAQLALAALALVLLARAPLTYWVYYPREYRLTFENQTQRQDYSFNPDQPALALAGEPRGAILYTHETAMYYYLSHGGHQAPSVFLPVVLGTAQEHTWLAGATPIEYVVGLNPIRKMQGLELLSTLDIRQAQEAAPVQQMELHIANPGTAFELEIEWATAGGPLRSVQPVPAQFEGWLSLEAPPAAQGAVLSTPQAVRLAGLRLDADQHTAWPWQRGVVLQLANATGDQQTLELSAQAILLGAPFDITVVDDRGATILAQVIGHTRAHE